MLARLGKNQRGSSLAMTVVTLAVIGSTLAIMLSSFSTTSRGIVVIHRRVNAQSLVRRQIEAVKSEVYQPNPTAVPYTTLTTPAGYQIQVGVSYWVSATQSFTSTAPQVDDGLQLITAAVVDGSGEMVFQAQDIKRR